MAGEAKRIIVLIGCVNLTGEGYKESANVICKRFLVLLHEPKVDHLSAQITHALAAVDADIVGQGAFGVVLFDILGGDVLLALRALHILTLGWNSMDILDLETGFRTTSGST